MPVLFSARLSLGSAALAAPLLCSSRCCSSRLLAPAVLCSLSSSLNPLPHQLAHTKVQWWPADARWSSLRAAMAPEVADAGAAAPKGGQAARYVLLRNGQPQDCSQSSSDWLSSAPRGAYTTARTVGRKSVFEFEFHVERLAKSVQLMVEAEQAHEVEGAEAEERRGSSAGASCSGSGGVPISELSAAGSLRPLLCQQLAVGLKQFGALEEDSSGEVKITALVTWQPGHSQQGGDLWLHLAALPPRPPHPVKVEVRGAPRSNPTAKDSEWVRQRAALEAAKPEDVNEILLATEDGAVLEGMSSNFFAVIDGAVWTAGEGVLLGTVREVVLQICRRIGVPVVLEAPKVETAEQWEGAFISSTSRLLLPVDELALPLPDKGLVVHRSKNELPYKLEKLVLADIEANSSPVVD